MSWPIIQLVESDYWTGNNKIHVAGDERGKTFCNRTLSYPYQFSYQIQDGLGRLFEVYRGAFCQNCKKRMK